MATGTRGRRGEEAVRGMFWLVDAHKVNRRQWRRPTLRRLGAGSDLTGWLFEFSRAQTISGIKVFLLVQRHVPTRHRFSSTVHYSKRSTQYIKPKLKSALPNLLKINFKIASCPGRESLFLDVRATKASYLWQENNRNKQVQLAALLLSHF